MNRFQVFSLIVLGSFNLLACNSGSRNVIAGRQCPANYDPLNLKAAEGQKKTWNKGQNQTSIPTGTYVYQRADLIFTQKGDKGAIVHIEDSPQRGVFKTFTNCVRNGIKLSENNLSASANAVSKIVSKADKTLEFEAKELSFKMVDQRLVASSKVATEKPTSLEKIYEGKSTQLYMFPNVNNNVDYEVRSIYEDNVGTYVMSVKFKRVD